MNQPTGQQLSDEDVYFNAFSRRSGRILDFPLSALQRVPNGSPVQAPFQGAALASGIVSPTVVTGATVLPLTNTNQFPPMSFSVIANDILFNSAGTYNVSLSGTVTGNPGVQSAVTVTSVPSGTLSIVGSPSLVATTSSGGQPGTFDYPFLANVSGGVADIYFTASTASANVSIINGAVSIVKVA